MEFKIGNKYRVASYEGNPENGNIIEITQIKYGTQCVYKTIEGEAPTHFNSFDFMSGFAYQLILVEEPYIRFDMGEQYRVVSNANDPENGNIIEITAIGLDTRCYKTIWGNSSAHFGYFNVESGFANTLVRVAPKADDA